MAQRISEEWREAFRQVGVSGALARDYELLSSAARWKRR